VCGRYTESCQLSVFDLQGAGDGLSITPRTCFNYRQVVAPRLLVERMSIGEVTELSVSPSRADNVLVNVGRRHLIIYSADDDSAVAADVAALRRWYRTSSLSVLSSFTHVSRTKPFPGNHFPGQDVSRKNVFQTIITRMWANAQRDGRRAEHRWRPLFNAAKFG